MLRIILNQLMFMCLLLGSATTVAQSAATVLFSINNVIGKRAGTEFTISRGTALLTKDTIQTKDEARAKIKYLNGTLVTIGEQSIYKILAYSPAQSDIEIEAELVSGKIHSKTPGKKKEVLKTPLIAMAITGTEYRVYVPNDKTVYTEVIDGNVTVNNTTYTAGQSFMATPDGVKQAPFPEAGKVDTIDPTTTTDTGNLGSEDISLALNSLVTNTSLNNSANEAVSLGLEFVVPISVAACIS